MKNKVFVMILIVTTFVNLFSCFAFATENTEDMDQIQILHTFYSDGTFNAAHQHMHVLTYYDYANTEKSMEGHEGSALKFTGQLYMMEKKGKAFSKISDEIERAFDAGVAYLTFWAYIESENISPNDPNYAGLDLYLPTNMRQRGKWVFVKQQLTKKDQTQLYFKSVGVYTWLDDINIAIIPPEDSDMSIEAVSYKKKDGSAADENTVYYKSPVEIDFNYYVDEKAEGMEVQILKVEDGSVAETNVEYNGDKIIISPANGFERDVRYKIVLKNVTNIFGKKLADTELTFTTAKTEKRLENISVTSGGNLINNGDVISSVDLSCNIVNESDADADLNLVFAVNKDDETVKASCGNFEVPASSTVPSVEISVSDLKKYVHDDTYKYETYLLDEQMLPVEYEERTKKDVMTASASLKGAKLEFAAEFSSAEKRAVTVMMTKSENSSGTGDSIGYFKTGFTDEDGCIKINGEVSDSVESGDYFLLVYGEGVDEPYNRKVHYTGADIRENLSKVISEGTDTDIEALLDDADKSIDLKAMGIMLDEYENLSPEQKDYVCTRTADEELDSGTYTDCINMLNRYIVLAKLRALKNMEFAETVINNSDLLMIEKRVVKVFEGAKASGNTKAFSIIKDIDNYSTIAEFTEQIKKIAAITALNLVSGNDYLSVSDILTEFADVIEIDAEDSFSKNKISEYNQTLVLKELIGLNYTSAEMIKSAFDSAVNKYRTSSISGGGSSSGGGSGGGGSYRPKESITVTGRVEDIVAESKNNTDKILFTDIEGYDWAADAIGKLSSVGMLNGYADKTFRPAASINRAEFVKIIISGMFTEVEMSDVDFSDVKETDWYYPYVKRATALGLVNGINEEYFCAEEYITREQMAVICKRVIDKCKLKTGEVSVKKFKDIGSVSEYAYDSVSFLQKSGIINGDENGCFNPQDKLTRAEGAKIIYEIYTLMEEQKV